jgi:hypothetical protein
MWVISRVAGLLVGWTSPGREAGRRGSSDQALRERALGMAERLAYLVVESRVGRPVRHPVRAESPTGGGDGETALVRHYLRYCAAEVGRLREDFRERGLEDPGLEAHWREPGSGAGVVLVSLALERLGWSLGSD